MPRPRTRDLKAAIDAQTRQRSVEDLAASGRRLVRVLSTKDVIRLIHAVVDQVLADGSVALERKQREALAARARARFEHFAGESTRAAEKIRRQGETIVEYQCLIEALQKSEAGLQRQLEEARAREERLGEIRVLLRQLGERGGVDTGELQQRFSSSLDQALDQIDRAVRRTTSRPVEVDVDATDPLLARIFDDGEQMESNTELLDLEESESSQRISDNLERLKALRRSAGQEGPRKRKGPSADKGSPTT